MSFRTILSLFLLLSTIPAWADYGNLVGIGENWHYFKAGSSNSPPAARWQHRSFDDSFWRQAPSGIELPDTDDGPIPTRPTEKPGHAFMRHKFTVRDPQSIKSLLLRVEHEQGFIAYLNGVEIARAQGRGPLLLSEESLPVAQVDISAAASLLVEGENVLAMEGSYSGANWSTYPLAAMVVANFPRGPFIQNTSTNSTQIIWRTVAAASTYVEYGTTAALGSFVTNAAFVTNHVATLMGLAPGTLHYYRVGSVNSTQDLTSAVETFRTLKMSGPISFAVYGDSGQATAAQAEVAKVMREANVDLVLHTGDVIYSGWNDTTADTRYFNFYQAHMKNVPYFLSIGNHDTVFGGADSNATPYQAAFYLPTNSANGTKMFYSFDHGDAHFVALYNPWFQQYVWKVGNEQYNWLTNDLANSTKPWKFLYFHMPVANSGMHSTRDDNANGTIDRVEMMNIILPVAQQYGVQFVFCGHDHNFERFAPTNGLHYLVTGGGGGAPYPLSTNIHPADSQFWPSNHYTKVTVDGDTLTLQAIFTNGVVFDAMTIQKAFPPRQLYQSTWKTPLIESVAGSTDGNITGQTFNLGGTPMLTRAGQFSNLGRVFVNNDSTNLYVGIDQAMFYKNNNLFLFVESPRQTGVTTMAGLGNGIVDPTGQGADGLDCLENLSFANFAPSIGCILGDEFADGQYRSFLRTNNLTLNIGQGIFRLDAALSTVPGTRLQQFNRSPQGAAVTYEQNADLIELSIPFSELGNLKPGDTIKIGAVVGGGEFNTGTQTRQLDTAALGYSLTGSGQTSVVLEGVSVQLATDPAAARLALSLLTGTQLRISWTSLIGLKYDIEYADRLTNFSRLNNPGLPRTATSTNENYDLLAPTNESGIYRIRSVP